MLCYRAATMNFLERQYLLASKPSRCYNCLRHLFILKELGKTAVWLVSPKTAPLMLLRAMSVFCVSSLT